MDIGAHIQCTQSVVVTTNQSGTYSLDGGELLSACSQHVSDRLDRVALDLKVPIAIKLLLLGILL